MALIVALLFVVVLAIVAIALLFVAGSAAGNTMSVQDKNQVYDAADTGLNAALDALDNNSQATTCANGTVNNYSYTCGINPNFNGATGKSATDPSTGNSITIPVLLGLVWGQSSSLNGGRTVTAEGLVAAPRAGLNLPPGAINAANNVTGSGDIPVLADPSDTNPHDASVHANNSVSLFAASVDGPTYAVGTDSMPGWNGATNSGAPPVTFPTSSAVTAFAATAKAQAQAGTSMTAAAFVTAAATNPTYTGNLYINGTVHLSAGTVTLKGAGTIYVNGSLCADAAAKIVNAQSSLIVVSSQVAITGNAYTVNAMSHGVLVALGTNATPSCAPGLGAYAAQFGDGSSVNLGQVYTPNGSTTMSGNGRFTGAFVCGINCDFQGGGNGLSLQYDAATTGSLNTRHARLTSYTEY